MQTTLRIYGKKINIRRVGTQLLIIRDNRRSFVTLKDISHLICFGQVFIDAPAQLLIAEHKITMTLFTEGGKPLAKILPFKENWIKPINEDDAVKDFIRKLIYSDVLAICYEFDIKEVPFSFEEQIDSFTKQINKRKLIKQLGIKHNLLTKDGKLFVEKEYEIKLKEKIIEEVRQNILKFIKDENKLS